MLTPRYRRAAQREQGWIGLIGLLLALLIIALLGRTLLRQLLPDRTTTTMTSGNANAVNRVPGGAAPTDVDVTTAPRDALERARNVQSEVREQAADLSKRIDEQTK